jgi:hypothetical protein
MNNLDPRIGQGLRAALETVARRGELLSAERLQEGYAAFHNRISPDRLSALDGEALLQAMHTQTHHLMPDYPTLRPVDRWRGLAAPSSRCRNTICSEANDKSILTICPGPFGFFQHPANLRRTVLRLSYRMES